MSDDLPDKSPASPAEDPGIARRETSNLNSFKSSNGTGGAVAGKSSASGGKNGAGKKPIGRPPKNGAGFSKERLDETLIDPEVEAARVEFEACLVELLVATTENFRDARYEVLKSQHPEAVARGLADKALLTPSEKKYFSGVIIRLWRKYLGDHYLFSDEAIASVYLAQYILRNWAGIAEVRRINEELKTKKNDQQPPVQSPTHRSDRGDGDRKINPDASGGGHTSG
ncbi:MAG TPA: hypothetical protein VN963_09815 [bacterium]|nr:hypothetical protein [bacterium]